MNLNGIGRGNSLVVQCLGLQASTAGARVQSLVRELRSCMPRGVDNTYIHKQINRYNVLEETVLFKLAFVNEGMN